MDTGTLTGLVAYNPRNPAQTEGIRAEILALVGGRQIVATNTALREFAVGVQRNAGPTETMSARNLASQIYAVFDEPSTRIAAIAISASFDYEDKIIFGTGDKLGIPTLTGNIRALRHIWSQGVPDCQGFAHYPARFREKFNT